MSRARSVAMAPMTSRKAYQARGPQPSSAGRLESKGRPRAVLYALMALLALAPLPLGSDRPLPLAAIIFITGVLLCLWAVQAALDARVMTIRWRRIRPWALGAGALFVWLWLQAGGLTPAAWDHPLWRLAPGSSGAIALAPDEARTQLLFLMSVAGVFWLSAYSARRPEGSRVLLYGIVIAGTAYACYGLVAEWLDGDHVLWFDKTAYRGSVTGPYINRNAFAGYCGLVLITAMALLLTRLQRRHARRRAGERGALGIMGRTEAGLIAASALLFVALLLTQSRGGVAAALSGVAVLIGLVFLRPRRRRNHTALVAGGTVIVLLGALVIFGGGVAERFRVLDERAEGRAAIHSFTLERIAERPLLGAGLGAFPKLFRAHSDSFLDGWQGPRRIVFYHAHNSYLEFAAEAGVPALLLLLSGFIVLARHLFRAVRQRREGAAAPLAALAALVTVGVHAMVDFSIQIPANALTFAALLGCGFTRGWSRRTSRDGSDQGPKSGA